MSDSMARLRRKIETSSDLQSVVRTMKAMAASSVEQYERSVLALHDYYQTIELGLSVCLSMGIGNRKSFAGPTDPQTAQTNTETKAQTKARTVSAIVFGSDQGLVGEFNEVIADYTVKMLSQLTGTIEIWAVGERVHARLVEAGVPVRGFFQLPSSVNAIASLVGRIQIETGKYQIEDDSATILLFHNRPQVASLYEPVHQQLLPLDLQWQSTISQITWPTKQLPEMLGGELESLQALIHEYLFIAMFRGCAESLASENASRLAAMQRAEKNIDELLEVLHTTFHRQRQSSIDEELFDVLAGFEMLSNKQSG